MARAFKCDGCGKLFEHSQQHCYAKVGRENFETLVVVGQKYSDLCFSCTLEALRKFVAVLERRLKENDN